MKRSPELTKGVLCLAFHPDFVNNRKYYLNYHVRENDIFSPVIVERMALADLSKDAGGASRRLLKIEQPTVLHWGGMLALVLTVTYTSEREMVVHRKIRSATDRI